MSPDAVEIRNNYANLLVDLNRLNDALVVLNKILMIILTILTRFLIGIV